MISVDIITERREKTTGERKRKEIDEFVANEYNTRTVQVVAVNGRRVFTDFYVETFVPLCVWISGVFIRER